MLPSCPEHERLRNTAQLDVALRRLQQRVHHQHGAGDLQRQPVRVHVQQRARRLQCRDGAGHRRLRMLDPVVLRFGLPDDAQRRRRPEFFRLQWAGKSKPGAGAGSVHGLHGHCLGVQPEQRLLRWPDHRLPRAGRELGVRNVERQVLLLAVLGAKRGPRGKRGFGLFGVVRRERRPFLELTFHEAATDGARWRRVSAVVASAHGGHGQRRSPRGTRRRHGS